MGKKASGKNYTSKGERKSSMKTSGYNVSNAEKLLRKVRARNKGKDTVWLVEQTDADGRKRMVRERQSGKEWMKRNS